MNIEWVKTKDIIPNTENPRIIKDDKFINELPKSLFNKFNFELQKHIGNTMGDNYKMSIQYKQIKPEYEI